MNIKVQTAISDRRLGRRLGLSDRDAVVIQVPDDAVIQEVGYLRDKGILSDWEGTYAVYYQVVPDLAPGVKSEEQSAGGLDADA